MAAADGEPPATAASDGGAADVNSAAPVDESMADASGADEEGATEAVEAAAGAGAGAAAQPIEVD